MLITSALICVLAAPSQDLLGDTLIADINSGIAPVGSFSGGIAANGSIAWFGGIDPEANAGYRLWRTDGTTAGTIQLQDQAVLVEESIVIPGGDLVYVGDELGIGVTLWRSDGTALGTTRIFDPIEWSEEPRDISYFDGAIWFLAGVEGEGVEVWRADLATGAVGQFTQLVPGPDSGAAHLFAAIDRLFVGGADATRLWVSDGTVANTIQVASFSSFPDGSFEQVAETGGRVVFNIAGFGDDAGWWSSDGTVIGTFQLTRTINDYWAVEADTKIYLTAGEFNSSPQLQETDGTIAGTQPVNFGGTILGQVVGYDPGIAIGDELYYSGWTAGTGRELCRTTGAAEGGVFVAEIFPGSTLEGDPERFAEFDGSIYFTARDATGFFRLWVHDTINLTTQPVSGAVSAAVGTNPSLLTTPNGVLAGQLFPKAGVEPAILSDGQASLLLNIGIDGASAGSFPEEFVRFGSKVLFAAFDETLGMELWITDGTMAGTSLLADIDSDNNPPPVQGQFPFFGSFPRSMVLLGDRVFFFAQNEEFGPELWSTDGTTDGTNLVVDYFPGPGGSEPLLQNRPVVLGDSLFWIARNEELTFKLLRTDASASVTEEIATIDEVGIGYFFTSLTRVGDFLLFEAVGPEGREIFTSDGTAEGTMLLVDGTVGPEDSALRELVAGETVGYFSLIDGVTDDRSLWITDGTPENTEMFFSEPVSFTFFSPSNLATLGDLLFFSNDVEGSGREPWISDGTTAGTQLLIDIMPGADSSSPREFTAAGDRMYFAATDGQPSSHYEQVWISDGTALGTQLIADLPSPDAGAGVGDFWHPGSDRTLLFSNVDDNGEEWWMTDGTIAGTRALTDIAPGQKFATPRPGILLGSTLLFQANDGTNGLELHAFELAETGAFAATALGSGCAGSNGTPRLALESGDIAPSANVTLRCEDAAPGSLALWFLGAGIATTPELGACAVQVVDPVLLQSTAVAGNGVTDLTTLIPANPSLVGALIDVQALSVELGGPFLGAGALSDVLEIVIGD